MEGEEGRRLDGRNLIEDWLRDKKRRGLRAAYAWNRQQLNRLARSPLDHLIGLFAYSHLDFEADRDTGPDGDPSLAEMALAAMQMLRRSPAGFFLFIEGGRIDHAHHYNNAYRALDETLALDSALAAILPLVDLRDTLVVVTADHSHVLTMGALNAPRGNPILGVDGKVSDVDSLEYSVLLYGNGPGYASPRLAPANSSGDRNAVHSSAVPRQWATHAGEDVPVYAAGPLATRLFAGSVDQTYVPHAVAWAACLGRYASRCTNASASGGGGAHDADGAGCERERERDRTGASVVFLASSVQADASGPGHAHGQGTAAGGGPSLQRALAAPALLWLAAGARARL